MTKIVALLFALSLLLSSVLVLPIAGFFVAFFSALGQTF